MSESQSGWIACARHLHALALAGNTPIGEETGGTGEMWTIFARSMGDEAIDSTPFLLKLSRYLGSIAYEKAAGPVSTAITELKTRDVELGLARQDRDELRRRYDQERRGWIDGQHVLAELHQKAVVERDAATARVAELDAELTASRANTAMAVEAHAIALRKGCEWRDKFEAADAKLKAIGEAIREEARAQLQPGEELPEAEVFITALLDAHGQAKL